MALPAQDSFDRGGGTGVEIGSNWTDTNGTVWQFHQITPPAGGHSFSLRGYDAGSISMSYWNADSFGNDQYSQILVNYSATPIYLGAGVRYAAGADGYAARADGYITRYDNASGFSGESSLASGLTNADHGDTLRCEAEGTTIRRKLDGVTEGSATDATYSSGSAGIWAYGGANIGMNDFEGGNLGAAGPVGPGHEYIIITS
jgi:hypothetical protein